MCGGNRCHACHPRVVKFRHWAWYEWLTAILLIIAWIYSIYGIISTSMEMVRIKYPEEDKLVKKENSKTIIVRPAVSVTVLATLLTAHCFLFVATILGLLWLKYLRNMCIFLATFVLLVVAIIIYFLAGGVIQYSSDNNDELKADVFNHVYKRMRGVNFALTFRSYQRENGCCGVNGYRDWVTLSKVDGMTNPPENVPDSCCPTVYFENCGVGVMKESLASTKMIGISKRGCFDDLWKLYVPIYRAYAIEAFVVAFLLIGLLLLLLYICHRLYLQLVRPRYYNENEGAGGDTWSENNNQDYVTTMEVDTDSSTGPRRAVGFVGVSSSSGGRRARGGSRRGRDRDDDRESYIVPGTPAKSMISDDEQTFYAP